MGFASAVLLGCTVAHSETFSLTKGKNSAVCEAYVRYLNQSEVKLSPQCSRGFPSGDGFAPAKAVELSREHLYEIGERVVGFIQNNDQDWYRKERQRLMGFCDEPSKKAICEKNMRDKKLAEDAGGRWLEPLDRVTLSIEPWIAAWRIEPEMDVDNDGTKDHVLFYRDGRCGDIDANDNVLFPNTYALLMDKDYARLDEEGTRRVFGHLHEWPAAHTNPFRYVGTQLGMFAFRGHTYFDSFFTTLGNFEGTRTDSASLRNTLGVFIREKNKTQEVCELMLGRDAR
jgi:hypothetical protein